MLQWRAHFSNRGVLTILTIGLIPSFSIFFRRSQFHESLEKSLPVSDGAHKRRRELIENERSCRYSEPDRRVLRSVMNKAKQVLPRRSRRLNLKVLYSIHFNLKVIVLLFHGLIYSNLHILFSLE